MSAGRNLHVEEVQFSDEGPIEIGMQMRALSGRPAQLMGVLIGALPTQHGVVWDQRLQLEGPGETESFMVGGRLLFAGGGIYRVWGSNRNVTEAAGLEQEVAISRERIELAVSAGGLGFLEWFEAWQQGQIELPAAPGAHTEIRHLAV